MKHGKETRERKDIRVHLGRCGEVTLHVAADRKRPLIGFDVDADGFDKSGLSGCIDALKNVRDKVER